MTISGISSNAYLSYTGYNTTSTSTYSRIQNSTESTMDIQGVSGQQGSPPPPPPPAKSDSVTESSMSTSLDLDSDEDGVWSADELDAFASYAASTLGIEIDTDSILASYDTDEDGAISSIEEVSMAEDNAFGLASPQEMMQQMRGFSQPAQLQTASLSTTYETDSTEEATEALIEEMLKSYSQQNQNLFADLVTSSTASYNV